MFQWLGHRWGMSASASDNKKHILIILAIYDKVACRTGSGQFHGPTVGSHSDELTFSERLQVLHGGLPVGETGASIPASESVDGVHHYRPVILIVDNERGVHEFCQALLADQYDLLRAHDGPAALASLDSHSVDLVLLDLRLPGVYGLEMLAQIHAIRPQLKVIILTGVLSVRTAVEAMRNGAFHYLTKPFSGEELCLLIKAALRTDREDARVVPRRHLASPHTQRPGASVLFVGSALGPLVTLKLMLEQYVMADVAANTTSALRWLSQHLPALLVVHESLLSADSTRLVRIVQSMTPTCPVLLVSGSTLSSQLPSGLAALPMYRLTGDPDSLARLLQELIEVLAIRHTVVAPPPAFSPYVVKALSYISTHYAEALQVITIAAAIGVSAGHLAHLFPIELRVTVKEYVTKVRIEVAKQLLYEPSYTLDHIAEKVGFSDASHLSRVFLRYAGYRPGMYRRYILST
jgi:DNA-binding response OmpR family regulator/AraC-like DNA-binding protein